MKPRLLFRNEQLIMTLPIRYMNSKDNFHYYSGVYLHCFFELEKQKYSHMYDNFTMFIENSYIHQLYNIPTNLYYKLKINNYHSSFFNLVNDYYYVNNRIYKKQITIDIFNDTNELFGYINNNVDIIR